jgi:two-component system, chemotaxis family, protein-glutamate methylesterase/glutaminase
VQDPEDAAYPDMPRNALKNADIDHSVPLAEMGALLTQLLARRLGRRIRVPRDVVTESRIAERVLSDLEAVEELGDQVPFNCPGCGGVLWKMAKGDLRYRCHTGHSYTAPVLLAEQTAKIEETLWVALRMFEERRNLLMTMATEGRGYAIPAAAERARDSMVHIRRIRAMLTSGDEPPLHGSGHKESRGARPRKAAARRPVAGKATARRPGARRQASAGRTRSR